MRRVPSFSRWSVLAVAGLMCALLMAGQLGDAAAQPRPTPQSKPEGEMRWALYVTLSPVWFDPGEFQGLTAFWGIFVIFATMGIDALAIPGAPGATSMLMRFLPRLLSALLIVVVGWLAANFLGQAVLITAVNAGILQARLLARTSRWVVLLFAVATALVEIGIGRDMVLIAFGVLFGGLVLALALAFGLGGRHLAREILERGRRRDREPVRQDSITHL